MKLTFGDGAFDAWRDVIATINPQWNVAITTAGAGRNPVDDCDVRIIGSDGEGLHVQPLDMDLNPIGEVITIVWVDLESIHVY